MPRRDPHCPTCRDHYQAPVTCAPLRCYCGHPECPAYSSYIDIKQARAPITIRQTTNNTWAEREHDTWIDNL